jgi:hypothetical protein
VLKGQFDRRTRLPILEDDAEQQLINFVEWLGLAGTVAPDSIEGYVSAVKAIHMVWCGHPYAAMSPLFFRLPKAIQGLRKSRAIQKIPPMKGISRRHLETRFQKSGTDRGTSEPSAPATETKANRNIRGKLSSAEGLMTLMWQAVLRPDEALGTENKPNEPQCSYLIFFNRNSMAVSYATPYALISYVEYHPHGRKNDQVGENPPMAGPAINLVQVYRTGLPLHWEFLRLWTGFELPSSCINLPCYALNLNRNSFCVMRWPQIDLGAQNLNDIQRPKSFSNK